MASPNTTFTEIVASTLKNYRSQLADNVMEHQALLWELKRLGYFVEEEGGETLVEPLMHGENSTVRSYSGYDLIDTTPQEGITAAEFEWKQIAGSVSISGKQEFQNSGSKTKIFSLLQAKIKQLELSMQLAINEMLHGDGTGNSSKDITGLGLLIEDGTAWSQVGGIDSNAYSFWRNTWAGTVGSFAANGVDTLRNLVNSASRGKDKIKLLLTTQAIYEAYEKTIPQESVTRNNKLADAGFQNIEFKGIPIVFDEDMPSGEILGINTEYLKFRVGRGKNFVNTPFVVPDNQDDRLSKMILYGNFTISNRKRHFRATGVTTP